MDKVLVSSTALLRVLTALNGPDHAIRELQVLRRISESNPIDTLIGEYAEAVEKYMEGGSHDLPQVCM